MAVESVKDRAAPAIEKPKASAPQEKSKIAREDDAAQVRISNPSEKVEENPEPRESSAESKQSEGSSLETIA